MQISAVSAIRPIATNGPLNSIARFERWVVSRGYSTAKVTGGYQDPAVQELYLCWLEAFRMVPSRQ